MGLSPYELWRLRVWQLRYSCSNTRSHRLLLFYINQNGSLELLYISQETTYTRSPLSWAARGNLETTGCNTPYPPEPLATARGYDRAKLVPWTVLEEHALVAPSHPLGIVMV